ncbi:MAG: TonB-dependent receptor [Bacteroidetes bacterium]|nr:TonB-dependent receptor [Bacteroidota bacterium]
MSYGIPRSCVKLFVVHLLLVTLGFAGSETVEGIVRDAQTGDPLPGANVMIVKTSLGASTDINGKYTIREVTAGPHTLRATYVGYKQKEVAIEVRGGQPLKQDFKLVPVGVEGEEIVVTAQAAGQKGAINQQLASMPIMNVVSAARIQELPDVNAAESVGRLPGVSLIRTGGEGSQVVIRGLSPQYNQITMDGVELSSNVNSQNSIISGDRNQGTAAASLLGDRGMDLSMISSSMLGGIEVIKAITPDMDATVLGGVVNFDMRKAAKEPTTPENGSGSWVPHLDLGSQVGYNRLRDSYNNYRFVGSVEKRFLDNSLGFFLQGAAERRNLSSNAMVANYVLYDKQHGDAGIPEIDQVSMDDVNRTRERVGGTFVVDYQHETGDIGFLNSLSKSTTNSLNNAEILAWRSDGITFQADERNNELTTLTNILTLRQDIPLFHVTFKASHAYSESSNPTDLLFTFWQRANGGFANRGDFSHADPRTLAWMATPNPQSAVFARLRSSDVRSEERTLNGSLDLETSIGVSEMVTGSVKFGGSVLHRTRAYDLNALDGGNYWLGSYPGVTSMIPFLDTGYDPESYLNGDYPHPYSMKTDPLWLILPNFRINGPESNNGNNLESDFNDYSGNETKSAGYAMLTLKIGEDIKLLPGVRYQNLTTTYSAMRGIAVSGGIQGNDTTVTQSHGYWLPMVHVRYTPLDWLTLHAAYTNTLTYPDYGTITPRYYIGYGVVYYNNFRINPARSENLDLVVSFHSNEIGLLAINGFKKRIRDLVFFSRTYTNNLSNFPELPQSGTQLFEFNTYINSPIPIDLWGIETEWQTNFWYLPRPFDGLILTVNYTHIFSEGSYPRSEVNTVYDDEGNMTQTVKDTFYTTRLLNQPNDILNVSFGYDYAGFSTRISMLYQDNIFKHPDFWMQNRVNSAAVTRWDLAVKQELPWLGMQVYLSLNNITGAMETDINQKTMLPASKEFYGMSGDLGLRVRL